MMLTVFIIACVLILIILLWGITTYNTFIKQKNLLKEALSGISVQQKRRYDLIPNLINTVKGYSIHEKDILETVTKLRSTAMQTKDPHKQSITEDNLSNTLKSLFAVAENYPNLKANESFLSLQKELSSIENEMQLARRYFNGTARNYNTSILSFPKSLIAQWFGFKEEEYFKLENKFESQVPEVKF